MNSQTSNVSLETHVLVAKGLRHSYEEIAVAGDVQRLQVLEEVNLAIRPGEIVAIMGASGSGKSTLLHLLGGLERAEAGEILIGGKSLNQLNDNALAELRNTQLGFVYQFHHLLPDFSAEENVAMPLIIRRMNRELAKERARELLSKVGLSARVLHRPGELSGGERQRVAIARALVSGPVCVLADEPTGNLDRKTALQVFGLMRQLNRELGTAFVLVTHDQALADQTDRVLHMREGRLAD